MQIFTFKSGNKRMVAISSTIYTIIRLSGFCNHNVSCTKCVLNSIHRMYKNLFFYCNDIETMRNIINKYIH